ncbi:MAG: hypothetical protein ACYC8T_22080 [Myxococcaceae bacterium]
MRSRSVAIAIAVALLCAGGAIACYVKASALRTEAEWFLVRGNAEAEEYSATLDSATAERQLVTFEVRREVLERAHGWQRLQLLLVLAAVGSALGAYLLYLFFRLRTQLDEVGDEGRAALDHPPR